MREAYLKEFRAADGKPFGQAVAVAALPDRVPVTTEAANGTYTLRGDRISVTVDDQDLVRSGLRRILRRGPAPGVQYTQAQVEGTRVVVEAAGRTYDYRFGANDTPHLCQNGPAATSSTR